MSDAEPKHRFVLGAVLQAVLALVYIVLAVWLLVLSGPKALWQITKQFDPLFFQYNIVLLLLAQLLVPSVTLMYIRRMAREKERRLRRQMPDRLWRQNEAEILGRLEEHFRWGNYFGSVLLVSVIITLGVSIILLLKPVWGSTGAPLSGGGVDYERGANFLLLGPVIEAAATSATFHHRLVLSLTAFQFGFLGGFAYFIGHLVRSYFTLDLTPHTYVESSVRMISASLLSLVISFALPLEASCSNDAAVCSVHFLPLVAFFLGYFPNRALLLIEKLSAEKLGYKIEAYASTPLSLLQGMSYAHEVRLGREGFDNVENLAHADTIDLAIRTGFDYRQLRHWIGQAWLMTHLGSYYGEFAARTAITTRHELRELLPEDADDGFFAALIARWSIPPDRVPPSTLYGLLVLVKTYEPHVTSRAGDPPLPGQS
jgi:hypothetical protein